MADKSKIPQLNKVKNRILFLSPTVKECLERECCKEDFYAEGERPIGKGGFGQVWKIRNKITNKVYAIKVINKQNIIEQKMCEQMNREIEIMYKINHPYIVKLVNHYEDDENLYLIMSLAGKGQLYSILKKAGKFDQRTSAQYMREVISAVKYLHTNFDPPIIHRDIKPENILIDEYGKVKLADFGWSNYEKENSKRTTYCGTPEYLAPEMIRKEGHNTSVDIWYLGILMFELLNGYTPFVGINQTELFNNIKKHKINWPADFPSLAKNLISKILKQNPSERITLDEILNHPWFLNNPPLRQIDVQETTDPRKILESHLINISSKSLKEEQIKSFINRPSRIKKASSKNNIQELNYPKTNSPTKENFIGNSIQYKLDKNHNNQNDVIEKYEKSLNELKLKVEKIEDEKKGLKNEINKHIKDKSNFEFDIFKLKEENDRYKQLNKDRLVLLTEIEEGNNQLIETKNKLKFLENENETLKRNLKAAEEKIQNLTKITELSDVKNRDLREELDNLIKEKEDSSSQYQKKIKVLEAKFFDKINEESGLNIETLLEMVKESLDDLKQTFNLKIEKLMKLIREEKDEEISCDTKLKELILERSNGIKDLIDGLKNVFSFDIMSVKSKIFSESNNKIEERVNWLKAQINELMPYKNKYLTLETEIEKLRKNNQGLISQNEANKSLYDIKDGIYLETLNILNSKNEYINNIEAKLSDLKDFVYRNCPDQLEELTKIKI